MSKQNKKYKKWKDNLGGQKKKKVNKLKSLIEKIR